MRSEILLMSVPWTTSLKSEPSRVVNENFTGQVSGDSTVPIFEFSIYLFGVANTKGVEKGVRPALCKFKIQK